MAGNTAMRVLVAVIMVLIITSELVVAQTQENIPPILHRHPSPSLLHSQFSTHGLLSPTPAPVPPFHLPGPGISSSLPLDRFEKLKAAKCVGDCAVICFKKHQVIHGDGGFAYCFGDCVKNRCGSPFLQDSTYDCTLRCSESISTDYELGCYRLYRRRAPGTFTYCFGECTKELCGTHPPSFAIDCISRCSDSINTNYELDMDEVEGYMANCYNGCGGNH